MISCNSSIESKNRFISLIAFSALLDFSRADAIWGPHVIWNRRLYQEHLFSILTGRYPVACLHGNRG